MKNELKIWFFVTLAIAVILGVSFVLMAFKANELKKELARFQTAEMTEQAYHAELALLQAQINEELTNCRIDELERRLKRVEQYGKINENFPAPAFPCVTDQDAKNRLYELKTFKSHFVGE